MSQGAFVLVEICPANVALQKYPDLGLEGLCFRLSVLCLPHREWVSVSPRSGSPAVAGGGATCSPCWLWGCGMGAAKPEHEQEVSLLFFPDGGQTCSVL